MDDGTMVDEVGFDAGPDDTYTEGDDLAPSVEQVAQRVHELRNWLESAAGRDVFPSWWSLDPEEQAVAEYIVAEYVDELTAGTPFGAAVHAPNMHDRIAALSGDPGWSSLDHDARVVAIDIIRHVREWLRYEGTVTR